MAYALTFSYDETGLRKRFMKSVYETGSKDIIKKRKIMSTCSIKNVVAVIDDATGPIGDIFTDD
jgi:hypothetical protein